jgi:hypothetical protein
MLSASSRRCRTGKGLRVKRRVLGRRTLHDLPNTP